MAGDYLCQVTDEENNKVNRTIHVYVHGMLIYCFISQYTLTCYVYCILFTDQICPHPSPVINGHTVISGQTPGSCYTVICQHGYHLNGNPYRTCQSNGEWSGHTVKCVL